MNNSLGKEVTFLSLIKFTLPTIIMMVFFSLYTIIDGIFVSRYIGSNALSAINIVYPVICILIGISVMMATGGSAIVAKFMGEAKDKEARESFTLITITSIIFGLIIAIFSLIFIKQIIYLLGSTDSLYENSHTYLFTMLLFTPVIILKMLFDYFLITAGNPNLGLLSAIIGGVTNIILDYIFIYPMKMGVAGAGYATVFSQGISAVLCLFYIYRSMPDMWPEKHHWKLHAADSRHQLSMGIPMALQFAITASGTMIMQAAINLVGSEAVAAFTAACKLQNLVTQGFSAMGQTMATYSGQNFGKGDIPRIKKGVRAALLTSITYSIAAAVLVFLLLKPCLSLFFSGDVDMAAMMPWAKTYSYMCALFYVPLCTIFIFRNAMQGCGYGFLPMMGGVSELFARLIVAVIAIKVISYPLACFCDPAAWVTAAVFTGVSYLFVMKDIDKKYNSKIPTAPIS